MRRVLGLNYQNCKRRCREKEKSFFAFIGKKVTRRRRVRTKEEICALCLYDNKPVRFQLSFYLLSSRIYGTAQTLPLVFHATTTNQILPRRRIELFSLYAPSYLQFCPLKYKPYHFCPQCFNSNFLALVDMSSIF